MNDLIDQLIDAGIEKNEAKKEISILYKELGKENLSKIKEIVNQRIKTRTPIQYLLGKAYFMDFEVKVNKNVLIPRPETEILVEEMVKRLSNIKCHPERSEGSPNAMRFFANAQNDKITALDIGTGSGIIPIALAKLIPNIKIIAIDIEEDIIALAKENAKKNNVNNQIDFNICDLFSNDIEKLLKNNDFDLIVSNPPYIKDTEPPARATQRQAEVLHEPKIALYGSKENKTGLIYYERIIELVKKFINVKLLAFEIDPPLVKDLKTILKKERLNNFEIVKDYAKLERYLFVHIRGNHED